MKNKSLLLILVLAAICNPALAEEDTVDGKVVIKKGSKTNVDVIRNIKQKTVGTKSVITLNAPEENAVTRATYEVEKIDRNINMGACDIFEKNNNASFTISLRDAVGMTIDNNIALNMQKLDPEVYATSVETAKAEFDTSISAEIQGSDKHTRSINKNDVIENGSNHGTTASIEASNKSTSGIQTTIGASVNRSKTTSHSSLYASRLGIDVTAPLMRGAGHEVNLVTLKKAELDLDWSKYELYGYVLDLISETEKKYWDYYMKLEQLKIVQESLDLAMQQREETKKRVDVGKIAESELAAADAEVALCQEDLIDAESNVVTSAVALLRSINPDSDNFWKNRPSLKSVPKLREIDNYDFNLDDCIADALILRPELRQAELQLRKNELDVVASKNGMLPKLDFFLTLGKTGYSDSFKGSEPSFNHKEPFDSSVGLVYQYNPKRRSEKAKLNRANLNVKLQKDSIKNLEQVVKEDVIKAYIEIKRAKEQLAATNATTQRQEEKLRVENVKFNVGKTTAFQVAQAQRDLTEAKLTKVKAIVSFTTAKTDLLRATGLLLKFRGIEIADK